MSDEDLQKELKKYDIDYYFFWGDANTPQFLSRYRELTHGEIPGLKIYSLKEKDSRCPVSSYPLSSK